jgi:hypothetical protein
MIPFWMNFSPASVTPIFAIFAALAGWLFMMISCRHTGV